jgi:endonuclease I
MEHVRKSWKKGLRNPENCPSCYADAHNSRACQQELNKAVARGRYMIREMVGVIQLKKYRSMKKRYGEPPVEQDPAVRQAVKRLEGQQDATATTDKEPTML